MLPPMTDNVKTEEVPAKSAVRSFRIPMIEIIESNLHLIIGAKFGASNSFCEK